MKITKINLTDGGIATVIDSIYYRLFKSENYNFMFFKKNGYFISWNKGNYIDVDKSFGKSDLELYTIWSQMWKEKGNIYEFTTDLKKSIKLTDTTIEYVDSIIFEKTKTFQKN